MENKHVTDYQVRLTYLHEMKRYRRQAGSEFRDNFNTIVGDG